MKSEKLECLRKRYLELIGEMVKLDSRRRKMGYFEYLGTRSGLEFAIKQVERSTKEEYRRIMTSTGRVTVQQSTTTPFVRAPGAPERCKSAEMEEIMEKVRKVPASVAGRPDGVEAMSDCVVAHFDLDQAGKPLRIAGTPEKLPCKIMASCSNGTVSISAHGVGVMLTARMDELKAIIAEAEAATA